ncbi:PAS domain-containing protein [Sinorhizobium sp. BG8]|uniref:PAS domain-containing protein n=1 Tax=Sinorhizobium sp. BG8 TaxID=2613773 RepID=UPI00193DEB3F|nr:PAS domain-containing protein [Sinorhizobium sp. BG8]
MRTRVATQIYEYWNRLRGDRELPDRKDIEPADVRGILPDLFILEQAGRFAPRFRLAGTRLCANFGRELRGIGFPDLWSAESVNRTARITENVMRCRTPAVMQVSAYGQSASGTEAEVVLLPLSSQGGACDRVLGAFAPIQPIDPLAVPFRYMTLSELGVIDPSQQNAFLRDRPSIPVPQSVFAVRGLGDTFRRVLHLRVFEGGRQG